MAKEIEYQSGYINCSRDQLLNATQKQVKNSRYEHILRVEETAINLAKEHHYEDLEKVSISSILHDYAKDMELKKMLSLAKEYWNHPDLDQASDGIWHGLAAAQIAINEYDCKDNSILNAIAGHTTGWYKMDELAQIVYLADYIEPKRDFSGVEKARKFAEENLIKATTYKMISTIEYLLEKEVYIFPGTIEIYNEWLKNTNK